MSPKLIDWSGIDHVLLDMDGTVLDLAYDNHFWSQVVPERYGAACGLSAGEALAELQPVFEATQGTLNFYCLDYWAAHTGLDLVALKYEFRHRIGPLPGSIEFLDAVRASGRLLWLVTNAHPGSWRLKLAETGLHGHFDRIISSHDFGMPKEHGPFWPALQAQFSFNPERALFADDSMPVLRAAREFGIGQVIAIAHPDSSAPRRAISEFIAVDRLQQLLPVGN